MIIQTEHLGKVSVTVEKDYHNINKCYDKLTIVEEENEFRTYISRKPVPNGVELTDRNYWIPFSSLERQIVIDYNKFKNDVLFASAFHEKLDPTLPEGVAIIKQLFDKDNNPIIPKVSEEAVSDETGKTLKAKLAELTTTLSNTIDTYLNTYFADTIEKAEDIVNHPTYIGEDNYVYVWNRITKTYDKTSIYTRGEGFHVSKTFASVADMEAYTGTDLKEGDFVLIQSTPDDPDNAKLYTYSGTQGIYKFLVDMSGALGFTGKTPQFSIGTIITVESTEQASASLSPDGTDVDGNPKYKLNLALPKGEKGTSDFVIVDDHSGAGDDPNKIYIPSANAEKENAIAIGGKQDTIEDLAAIRSGAAAGATALQPSALDDFYNKSQVESLLAFEVAEGSMSAKLRGSRNVVSGEASMSTGQDNNVSGVNAFASGEYNSAFGRNSFVHGNMSEAIGNKSHAEGNGTRAKGDVSHAEGSVTISNGGVSHSEGYGTVAHDMSHTEGIGAIVFKIKSLNDSDPIYKVTTGVDTLSNIFIGFFIATVVTNNINKTSCALITNIEIKEENTELGITSEEAGIYITTDVNLVTDPSNETRAYILVNSAFTPGSHVEGYYNVSASFNGFKSFINSYIHSYFDNGLIHKIYGGHAEGIGNFIGGKYSHAEGALNATNNAIVHVEGKGNIANADYQHVEGKFNEPDNTAAHIIGNGTDNEHRSNALSVDWNGNLKIGGNLKDSQGNIIDTTKLVVVEDHSGAGDNPSKIYIPSAESHKQLYDGLIDDEEVLIKELHKREDNFQRHINNEEIHVNAGILQDIENSVANNRVLSKLVFAGHDGVDLGLLSGNLWATMNIGATRIEEKGYHFMWGDTTLRSNPSDFTTSNCMYFDGTNYADKYKAVLKVNGIDYFIQQCNIEDDVANKQWKACWQIPTLDDFIELANCFSGIDTINGIECFLYYKNYTGLCIPVSNIFDNGNIINGTTTNSRYLVRDIEGVDRFSVVSLSGRNVTRVNDSIYKGFCVRPVLKLK